MLNNHLNWESRANYLKLLEDFRKGKINDFEFSLAFEERGKLTNDVADILESNLILLWPHEKSFGFSDLLENIFDLCTDRLEESESYDENAQIEFQNYIEEIDSQIEKYLDE